MISVAEAKQFLHAALCHSTRADPGRPCAHSLSVYSEAARALAATTNPQRFAEVLHDAICDAEIDVTFPQGCPERERHAQWLRSHPRVLFYTGEPNVIEGGVA